MNDRVRYAVANANDIARYYLSRHEMSHKKLQKIIYYAYVWFIALNNDDAEHIVNVLFAEQPEAWVHGPVFPSVYNEYKSNSWEDIQLGISPITFKSNALNEFLEQIWSVFGDYNADQLEFMTHHEAPWKVARKRIPSYEPTNVNLDNRIIFEFYNSIND